MAQRRLRTALLSISRLFCSWKALSRTRVRTTAKIKVERRFVRSRARAASAVWHCWRAAAARLARSRVLAHRARVKRTSAGALLALRAWVVWLVSRKRECAAQLRFELRRALRVWHAACRMQSASQRRALACALLTLLHRRSMRAHSFAVWAAALRARKVRGHPLFIEVKGATLHDHVHFVDQ